MSSKSSAWLSHAALVATFLVWGYNNVPMKIGGSEWNPVAFNGFRFAGAALLMWLYLAWYAKAKNTSLHMDMRDMLPLAGYALINSVALEVTIAYALQFSTVANAALLGRGMMPVWTGLFALLMREMALSPRIWIGLPLAMFGSLLIVGGNGFGITEETLKGDVLLFLRSIVGAIYLIGMKGLLQKYPVPLLLAVEFTISGLVLLPFAFYTTSAADLAAVSWNGWFSLLFTSIVALCIGFLIHNWGLARLGAFKASVYGYLLPLTAALAGYLVLGETIRPLQALGAAAVLAAMYLIQRDRLAAGRPADTDKRM